MCRQKPDIVPIIKDVLRPVAMVDIPVDYQHSLKLVLLNCMICRERNVVEQTKPHGIVGECMVSGRSDQAECGLFRAFHHCINSSQACPSSPPGNFVRLARQERILFDPASPCVCKLSDSSNVHRTMNAGNLFHGCSTSLRRNTLGRQSGP